MNSSYAKMQNNYDLGKLERQKTPTLSGLN
jgi:hypothetical protein